MDTRLSEIIDLENYPTKIFDISNFLKNGWLDTTPNHDTRNISQVEPSNTRSITKQSRRQTDGRMDSWRTEKLADRWTGWNYCAPSTTWLTESHKIVLPVLISLRYVRSWHNGMRCRSSYYYSVDPIPGITITGMFPDWPGISINISVDMGSR